ncbi:MAG: alpha/beta hydrolase [Candidatus Onthomonas sp.]
MAKSKKEKVTARIRRQRRLMNFLYRLSGFADSKGGREVLLDTEAGPVRTLWYGFDDPAVKPVFFDMHGGGFILMNADADGKMCAAFAQRADCKVISIDYALAPEHPFPTAVNQIYAVVKEVHAHAEQYGVDPDCMAIGGHSAGGNLAAAVSILAGRRREFSFRCQVLDFPPLDLVTSPYDKPCPKGAIKPETAEEYDLCYVPPQQRSDPLVSPVCSSREELERQPSTLIILAGHDSLHDEGLRYSQMLEREGVPVERHEFPEEPHGFTYYGSKGGEEAISLMADYLKKMMHGACAQS